MGHGLLTLVDVTLTLGEKTCFEAFSGEIFLQDRIGIIGANGSGKTSLIRLLSGELEPMQGYIRRRESLRIGYVPQFSTTHSYESGGQRFQKSFAVAMNNSPDLLLLDEPTNHLDEKHRRQLYRSLSYFSGAIVIVSHHQECLETLITQFWSIKDRHIEKFCGSYGDLQRQYHIAAAQRQQELEALKSERKKAQEALERERERATQSRYAHRHENDINIIRKMQDTASATTGRIKGKLRRQLQEAEKATKQIQPEKSYKPHFFLSCEYSSHRSACLIHRGTIAYGDHVLLRDFHFVWNFKEKIALMGENGAGKTSLAHALYDQPSLRISGDWQLPPSDAIGFLDQHYEGLDEDQSVLDNVRAGDPKRPLSELRQLLSSFLFRTNREVQMPVRQLSGGERLRCCLARIALRRPSWLILDEMTNHLDVELRDYLRDILKNFPGSLCLISHDRAFIQSIGIEHIWSIQDKKLICQD
ncbi:MAG: ATP-binding cassette domain-containing protein [Puniceicoccales bacterium]|jgi:ATPase subunit of ABC transporter with duplicated ATPase domains|nr:ATP-binding cassette domain-containing protein [Puniceicoccales bacterium]